MTGGRDSGFKKLRTTEIFAQDGTFQPGPDMPDTLVQHCQVQMGTSVYVVGGSGASGGSSSVFVLEGSLWREVSPMLTPREDLTCIAYHGKIYARLGWRSTVSVHSGDK